MDFLHRSVIESHGRLKSTNCLVDNRWTCKITGMYYFCFKSVSSLICWKFTARILSTPCQLLDICETERINLKKSSSHGFQWNLLEMFFLSDSFNSCWSIEKHSHQWVVAFLPYTAIVQTSKIFSESIQGISMKFYRDVLWVTGKVHQILAKLRPLKISVNVFISSKLLLQLTSDQAETWFIGAVHI